MSDAASLAALGAQALNTQKYQEAINYYTRAIGKAPTAVDYYIKRSTAQQRSSNYELALRDAEIAVLLGHQRGKRESIGQAQLRRGISCYLLERYGDAGFCFDVAKKYLGDKEKSVGMWISKLEFLLKDTDKIGEDDIRREVMVKEMPDLKVPSDKEVVAAANALEGGAASVENKEGTTGETTAKSAAQTDGSTTSAGTEPAPASQPTATTPIVPTAAVTPRDKIRNEWYQTPADVVFTLYVKGAPKDKTVVEIEEQSISISFPLAASSSDFTYDLDPLFAPIKPAESSFSVLSTKIELKLVKAERGLKWKTLEGMVQATNPTAEPLATVGADVSAAPASQAAVSSPSSAQKPVYPTSSKSGPKNWDKLVSEEDLEDEGDPVNSFFKKLYKDADEDTRRAMMKSYIESNGTALSTNWQEVGAKKVETSPPEGLVAKKWDE